MNLLDLMVALLLLAFVFLGISTLETHTLRLINRSTTQLKEVQEKLLWRISELDAASCVPSSAQPGLGLTQCTYGGAGYAKSITLLLPKP